MLVLMNPDLCPKPFHILDLLRKILGEYGIKFERLDQLIIELLPGEQ